MKIFEMEGYTPSPEEMANHELAYNIEDDKLSLKINTSTVIDILNFSATAPTIPTTPSGNFIGLSDTPLNYTGFAGYSVMVNATATGIEFMPVASGGTPSDLSITKTSTSNTITNTNGTGFALSGATTSQAGLMTGADRTKLNSIDPQVQSDWNIIDVNFPGYIKNKPTLAPTAITGFKNHIINGGFEIWQRGSGPHTVAGYGADRWRVESDNLPSSFDVYRQTWATSGVPEIYHLQVRGDATNYSGDNHLILSQKIENPRIFQNMQMTLSFSAKVASGTQRINVGYHDAINNNVSATEYTQFTLTDVHDIVLLYQYQL